MQGYDAERTTLRAEAAAPQGRLLVFFSFLEGHHRRSRIGGDGHTYRCPYTPKTGCDEVLE